MTTYIIVYFIYIYFKSIYHWCLESFCLLVGLDKNMLENLMPIEILISRLDFQRIALPGSRIIE